MFYNHFWSTKRSLRIIRFFFSCFPGEHDEISLKNNCAFIFQSDQSLQQKFVPNEPCSAYNMEHANRGVAMIFNQNVFLESEKPNRNGSDKDRNRLENALKQQLQFDVRVFEDLRVEEIYEELRKVARMDHINNDCLLITFMTHGIGDNLCSFHGDFDIKTVKDFFTDSQCPTLKGKPRIFLIQACRGESEPRETYSYFHVENNSICDDFFIVRSTMPGCKSYRNPKTGSWFIQKFCSELEASNNRKIDLVRLLGQVHDAVNNISANDPAKKRQTLSVSSNPRKDISFSEKSSKVDLKKKF